jgi:hypothetical protein
VAIDAAGVGIAVAIWIYSQPRSVA